MEEVSAADQLESIKSWQSTIKKLENAFAQMTQKGTNITLVKKRLNASRIGLAVLENVWNQQPHQYSHEDIAEARKVLIEITPSVEHSYAKSKARSPQQTLLERRLQALKLAVQAIDALSAK
ncbi:hypothetical protein P40081_07420 [Paenibacillus sp. FSL P4-0081]|uniref:hypothetical protein n=1 Tax=Paenibacillus sp. FSL P4-0081 TaxID=1536769 RepID=UPI0004F79D4D|nr:hypothetical protein [Paenibacillus sp. FSL P4-0081]AIQ28028.1 hypothetical protein P40081_07420 [Paenibacillus sp. FSL P4-0081]